VLDAYGVRKAIPRIVLAVIGINLSIYGCVAVIDIINVVSGGVAGMITAPFNTSNMLVFNQPTDATNAIAAGVGIAVAAGPLTSAIGGIGGAIATGSGTAILGMLFWTMVPIAFLAIAIVMTVVIRQALLLFLVIISPVAIACYVLPGTEKYFQQWWDIFLKTLMVYPIIAVIFALSDVFAAIIMSSNSGGLTGLAKTVTTIVVIYAPLFMIPFAFKFAGGVLGKVAGVAGGLADRAGKMGPIKSRQEHYKQTAGDAIQRAKAEQYRRSMDYADKNQGVRAFAARRRARAIAGYKADVYDKEAAQNKRYQEEFGNITNFGDDTDVRAYTANKEHADRMRELGQGEGVLWRTTDDGKMEYQSAGGKWVSEEAVNNAQKRFGKRNTAAYQQAMAYEMKKAITQEQQDNLVRSFSETMDTWGASESQANGVWIGAGFANQDKNRQWKHGRWSRDENGNMSMKSGAENLITEVDENIGSYQGAQSNADTWTTMAEQVKISANSKNLSHAKIGSIQSDAQGRSLTADEQKEIAAEQANIKKQDDVLLRASRIVKSIRTEQAPRDAEGKVIPGAPAQEIIGAGASGRTQEAMRDFAMITDQNAGKYTDNVGPVGPGYEAPERMAGGVEDSLNRRDR
jgi:TrbL/VirB6 plasmid conjugal transfer protein